MVILVKSLVDIDNSEVVFKMVKMAEIHNPLRPMEGSTQRNTAIIAFTYLSQVKNNYLSFRVVALAMVEIGIEFAVILTFTIVEFFI